MIARGKAWYAALTARERGMVQIAVGLALVLALAEGVLVPLGRGWIAARAEHAAASEAGARIMRQLAELGPARERGAPAEAGRMVADAGQAGVQLAPPEMQGKQRLVQGQGASGAVLAWLDGLDRQGFIVCRLALTPLPEGGVSVQAWLEPRS